MLALWTSTIIPHPKCRTTRKSARTPIPVVQISLPAWSVVGSGALLSGNTRLLLSTALILSEAAGCGPVLTPVLLACTLAKLVADALAPCIYDWQIKFAGFSFVEDQAGMEPGHLSQLAGKKVCINGRVV